MVAGGEIRFDTPRSADDTNDAFAKDRRHSTPHPKNSNSYFENNDFVFEGMESELELNDDSTHNDSCIGISLHSIMSTLKGEKEASPSEDAQRGFFPSLKAMMTKTLSSGGWSNGGRVPTTPAEDTLDDYDLINRLPSWNTHESPSVYLSRPQRHGTANKKSAAYSSKKQVQFQYPPITSIRLRPRTESDEVNRLYFAPEELDQIEDDRSNTRAADDIETLCVIANPSHDMDSLPGVVESMSSPATSLDSGGFSFISRRKSNKSTSPSSSKSGGKKKTKGIVRGVQILLREKSIG